MKTILSILGLAIAAHGGMAQMTAFTYQGRLMHGATAANGPYELAFALYDAAAGGQLVGTTATLAPVAVSNGLFTAFLDFGASPFTGAARWLEISVTPYGSDQPAVTLTPRQPISVTPYAIHAANAASLMSFINAPLDIKANGQRALRLEPHTESPNVIGGSSVNHAIPGVVGAFIGGGGTPDNGDGAGYTNRVTGDYGAVAGGMGNSASGASFIGGGASNRTDANGATIGGGIQNIIDFADGGTIAGGFDNHCSGDDSTIGGGRENSTVGQNCTVAGGRENGAGAHGATVGGGRGNAAHHEHTTIAGGYYNRCGGEYGTIGGGQGNEVDGTEATVGGGLQNTITAFGEWATIPGGFQNRAEGLASFAAGFRAHALHRGAFVWADGTFSQVPIAQVRPFVSTTNNEFSVRAAGGVRFVTAVDTNGTPTAGVSLDPGAGAWSNLSDRNAKENFAPTDPQQVLDKVAALPLATWNYKTQDKSVRHIGPTAQDFHAAFGVGENDRTISTVDADGVALAAIQGLNNKVAALEKQVAELNALVQKLSNSP